MKPVNQLLAVTVGAALLISTRLNAQEPARTNVPTQKARIMEEWVVESCNTFGFDVYGQLRQLPGDSEVLIAPASLWTALMMAFGGARGHTAAEMAAVLKLDRTENSLHEQASVVMDHLNCSGNGISVRAANRLWASEANRALLQEPFILLMRNMYRAEFEILETANPEASLNRWIAKYTRIFDAVPHGAVQPNSIVLTNSLDFTARWSSIFPEAATRPAPFHSTNGRIDIPTMSQRSKFRYTVDPDVQVVVLPFGDKVTLSMVVLLPKEHNRSLAAFEEQLTYGRFKSWMIGGKARDIQLHMPKFKVKANTSMETILTQMGMKSAFTGSANFSALAKNHGLHLSQVLHHATLSAGEKGAQGAAASTVVVALSPTKEVPQEPIVVRIDRPFIFVVRHISGLILFIGRIQQPNAQFDASIERDAR